MNKNIKWFTGPDANDRLEALVRKYLGDSFDNVCMPIDTYIAGSLNALTDKALFRNCIFLQDFYHHPQYNRIYAVFRQLLTQDVTIAIASKEEPHQLIADLCEVNQRSCRLCGCTDDNCLQCIIKTGHPCHWVADDLCSACADVADATNELTVIASGAKQSPQPNHQITK